MSITTDIHQADRVESEIFLKDLQAIWKEKRVNPSIERKLRGGVTFTVHALGVAYLKVR